MIGLKKSVYRLTKYFLAVLLMASFSSAFAGAVIIKEISTKIGAFTTAEDINYNLTTTTTWRSVSTPSGNEIVTVTGEDHTEITDLTTGLITMSDTSSFKERYLKKAGELQNEFVRSHSVNSYNNGTCSTTIWEEKYIYVNGQILLDQENHEEIPCE